MKLIWEQEAPGSNPGIPTKDAASEHVAEQRHDYQHRLTVS
jgi:hypothetical protein